LHEKTHIDLFSGIGGFAIAAGWAGFRTVCFCEIDPFCQEVLAARFPGVTIFPDVKGLTGSQIFDTIRSNEKRIQRNPRDVSGGPLDPSNSELLRSDPPGHVEDHEAARLRISSEGSGRGSQPIPSGDEGERPGAEPFGNSDSARDCSEKDALRELLGYGNIQGRENEDSGPPCGLREAPGSSLALPEVPPRMAHEEQGEGRVNVTLLTAGVPCQPASVAGKRRGTADDRWLWGEAFRIIHEVKPTWAILENVSGLLTLESSMVFDKLLSDLEGEGYEVQPVVIPACAVNAPHRRDRVWIIANRTRNVPDGSYGEGGRGWGIGDVGSPSSRREDATFGPPQVPLNGGNGRRGDENWDTPWPEVAARLCRVDDGLPAWIHRRRTERLKALGNSIVSQVAYEIIRLIP